MSQHQENVAVASITYRLVRAGLTEEVASTAAHYIYIEHMWDGLGDFVAYFKRTLKQPAHNLIWGGFIWSATPEGVRFWCDIKDQLAKGEQD